MLQVSSQSIVTPQQKRESEANERLIINTLESEANERLIINTFDGILVDALENLVHQNLGDSKFSPRLSDNDVRK